MLEHKTIKFIKSNHLIQEGDRILVGVSGGPDSLALLHFLFKLRNQYNIHLVCAHVDHMFRGEESYRDLLFVKGICEAWDIPFEAKRIDVTSYMKETGKSSQTAARDVRYEFYRNVMDLHSLNKLALGHHGDDQMETMLMRWTRGATGTARAGMAIQRAFHDSELFRPFISVTKEEILDYCKRNGLFPRIDPSNEKEVYVRNRFRKHVLPFLKQENALVHQHFQRFSEELLEDEQFLLLQAEEQLQDIIVEKGENRVVIALQPLLIVPKPLQRRAIQLILNYLYIERPKALSAIHIEHLLEMFRNTHPSGEIHLPEGIIAKKSYDECTFSFGDTLAQPYSLLLQIPGYIFLPNGYKITAQYIEEENFIQSSNYILRLPVDFDCFPLRVRTKKDGDRMKVKGLEGSKKLKDIFINAKIPLVEREVWPIVEDDDGNIIWLPGLKKSPVDQNVEKLKSFICLKYLKE
ncbi:tRNA lysidine(34) synthetase TilS [Peribacillus alkalitolerans]|uniref:tRNA lysidine(34) synthetase TilS n=1 Tax=Peribacillus alkalitolerans TaxID=1550385 RepID=UPI001F085EAB|nr:tRNA lysidine(34) synthetase TilS [Peribacillus alkalitolerans]